MKTYQEYRTIVREKTIQDMKEYDQEYLNPDSFWQTCLAAAEDAVGDLTNAEVFSMLREKPELLDDTSIMERGTIRSCLEYGYGRDLYNDVKAELEKTLVPFHDDYVGKDVMPSSPRG